MGRVSPTQRTWFSTGVDIIVLTAVFAAGIIWYTGRSEAAPPQPPSAMGQTWPGPRPAESFLAFVFRSDCPVCTQQKPNWLKLAAAAESVGVSVRALTPEAPAPGITDYFSADPDITVEQIASTSLTTLGVTRVPTTLLVNASGRVVFERVGVFSMSAAQLEDAR